MAQLALSWTAQSLRGIDWENDTINVILLDTVPDPDDTLTYDDLTADELYGGAGWPQGGVALTNPTVTTDNGTHTDTYDADDIAIDHVTVASVSAVAIYKVGVDAAHSPVIAIGVVSVGPGEPDASANDGILSFSWPVGGILTETRQ